MNKFIQLLSGGDLRTVGESELIVSMVNDQKSFNALYACLHLENRAMVMRAADAIEKISRNHPEWLVRHKKDLFKISQLALNKELCWHLALILPRLNLNHPQRGRVWNLLTNWSVQKQKSIIVRVNALQGLSDMLPLLPLLHDDFLHTLDLLEQEESPSITARVRKIRKQLEKSERDGLR